MKITLAAVALLLPGSPLLAEPAVFESTETQVTLLELFSSEGCSSCPPADAWISKLKTRPELWKTIVPVVFHVDYWDGLGWPDRFASVAYTRRQQAYAKVWRTNSIYTPGFVRNGLEWRNWAGISSLADDGAGKVGKLQVTLTGPTHAEVSFTPAGSGPAPRQVELALLGGNLQSDVRRGENSGRKLRHDFVVLHLATAALTAVDGRFTASLTLPDSTTDPVVALGAWVKAGESAPPIQATGGWLKRP